MLAVLISTIIPPFLLRYTITRFNKKAEALLKKTVQDEMKKKIEVDDGGADEDELRVCFTCTISFLDVPLSYNTFINFSANTYVYVLCSLSRKVSKI